MSDLVVDIEDDFGEEAMSDLVERLRQIEFWPSVFDPPVIQRAAKQAAARIEELERLRSAEAAEAARVQLAMNDEIEELERFVRKFADAGPREWLGLQEEARAVLEKGKQPSAAGSVGEEIENVAIVTRTVKAGQGRVEGEP
jgi:hypothetical protein